MKMEILNTVANEQGTYIDYKYNGVEQFVDFFPKEKTIRFGGITGEKIPVNKICKLPLYLQEFILKFLIKRI